LGELVTFISNKDLAQMEYMRKMQSTFKGFVKTVDRQDLLLFLTGKTATSAQVDKTET
jgi:hypothetical protein